MGGSSSIASGRLFVQSRPRFHFATTVNFRAQGSAVGVGVVVGVKVVVLVKMGVGDGVAVGVAVAVGVIVGVAGAVEVGVAVEVCTGVHVAVNEGVGDEVRVVVGVSVTVAVAVLVGVNVQVGVGGRRVGVTVGTSDWNPRRRIAPEEPTAHPSFGVSKSIPNNVSPVNGSTGFQLIPSYDNSVPQTPAAHPWSEVTNLKAYKSAWTGGGVNLYQAPLTYFSNVPSSPTIQPSSMPII